MALPSVDFGLGYTPQKEYRCPVRSLACAVILRAVIDYCESRHITDDDGRAREVAECEYRARHRQRMKAEKKRKGRITPVREVATIEQIIESKRIAARGEKNASARFLMGKRKTEIDWFSVAQLPLFRKKNLDFSYKMFANGSLSLYAIEELANAKVLPDNACREAEDDAQ